jgi:hypothetical protein
MRQCLVDAAIARRLADEVGVSDWLIHDLFHATILDEPTPAGSEVRSSTHQP